MIPMRMRAGNKWMESNSFISNSTLENSENGRLHAEDGNLEIENLCEYVETDGEDEEKEDEEEVDGEGGGGAGKERQR